MSLLEEIHSRHKRFHAAIAQRATVVKPKEARPIRVIPNVPFGQPKIPPKPPRNIEPDYWHKMWFHDLVFGRAGGAPKTLKLDDIYRATATEFGVTLLDLISPRRTNDVVLPRQVAMYLAKAMTARSLPEIAKRMGNRDHTTALHSINKIKRLIQTDIQLAACVEKIKASLS